MIGQTMIWLFVIIGAMILACQRIEQTQNKELLNKAIGATLWCIGILCIFLTFALYNDIYEKSLAQKSMPVYIGGILFAASIMIIIGGHDALMRGWLRMTHTVSEVHNVQK